MLYEIEIWPLEEEDMTIIERSDENMVQHMCNMKPQKRIKNALQLNSIRKCLHNRGLI